MFLSVTCRFNLAPWFSHQNSWHEFCLFKLFQKHPKTCHKHWPITIEVSGFIVSRTALFRARFTHLPQPLIAATTNPTPNIIKIIHAVHASLKRSRLPHQKKSLEKLLANSPVMCSPGLLRATSGPWPLRSAKSKCLQQDGSLLVLQRSSRLDAIRKPGRISLSLKKQK